MSLLYLETRDFKVKQDAQLNQPILCTDIAHISLILFFSPACQYSNKIRPIFQQCPQFIKVCQFGLLNVQQHPHVVRLSQQTTTPIKFVPLMILYIQGYPHMYYQGAMHIQAIAEWVTSVANAYNHKLSFHKSEKRRPHNVDILMGFAVPLTEEVTYLTVDEHRLTDFRSDVYR